MRWYQSESLTSGEGSLILQLFNASPEPAFIVINNRLAECNQAAVDAFGYQSDSDLLNIHPRELSPPCQPDGVASKEKAIQLIHQAEQQGIHRFEWEYRHASGSPISVIVTLLGMRTEAGLILYASLQDITETKRLHHSLLQSEIRFKELFKAMPNGVVLFTADESGKDFTIHNLNRGAEKILKRSRRELRGAHLKMLLPDLRKKEGDQLRKVLHTIWQKGGVKRHPVIQYKGHNIELWLDMTIYRLPSNELVAILEDNTDQEQNRIHLELFANVYHQSKQAILISDKNNQIISVNKAFTELTGYQEDEVIGHNPRILASGKVEPATYQAMWQSLHEEGFWQGELWDKTKDGHIYPKWISINTLKKQNGEIGYFIASFSDISQQKDTERRIHHLAYHDPLTGLLNRFSFEERLEQALSSARRYERELAILFIDLDNFKDINDSLGHQLGDELLKLVADRLRKAVRESDIVARLGGDEFIIAFTEIGSHNHLALKTSAVLNSLSKPYEIDGQLLYCSPSIGVSVYPNDGKSSSELMKNADAAMYHAKAQGRKNFQFFSQTIALSTQQRLQTGVQLHGALEAGQFELYFQPQIATASGRLYGLEALLRWNHPQRGLVSPAEFIPILEDTGLIDSVGTWVIQSACQKMAKWRHQGVGDFRVAVNLSARQLRSSQLVAQVKRALRENALPASALELEVTESAAMDNPELAIEILSQLSELGITIAIDDFGTGYSSLAYLKKLPIQTLKLDREFVRDIEQDENDAAISAATIALAHNLGLKVVAEGVETKAQQAFLQTHHCDILQGFLHGRPLPANEIEQHWFSKPVNAQPTEHCEATAVV